MKSLLTTLFLVTALSGSSMYQVDNKRDRQENKTLELITVRANGHSPLLIT